MRACVLKEAGRIDVEDVPEPVAGAHDVVLDVAACGVCGSDLASLAAGRTPGQVMGHEFAGTVREVGRAVTGITPGDRLTGLPIQPCGRCRRCVTARPHLCDVWATRSLAFGLPGAFAERLRIPDAVLGGNVHRLPDGIGFEDGAQVEPLSVAVHALRRAAPAAGRPAVVLGLGPIGLHAAQVLRAAGAHPVFGVERSAVRRAIGDGLGVHTLDGTGDVAARIHDELGGREVDLVVEASGAAPLVSAALDTVRAGGRLVLVALYHRPLPIELGDVVRREITVTGSAMVSPADFADAIDLIRAGAVATAGLVTHRYPLDDVMGAFHAQSDTDNSVKVMIRPA
ncbi:hypothetical protein BJF90_04695 [Pseudonocardia sp. CNS-004]|nr:hypothetical protein BJF90_04695 [Pseudonocardia sp. CNS-004]